MLPMLLLAAAAFQATPPAPADPARMIAQAASLGTILFALDRAAWVASDALAAKLPKDRLDGDGGWVVERGPEDRLIVTFYRGAGDAARAIFVAEVRHEKVVASRVPGADTALTPAQQRLARARAAAAAEATARGFTPCTPAPFNSVVLPSTDPQAPVLVYLMSAQTATTSVPLGGHYRFLIGADGKTTAVRPFSKACINTPLPPPKGGNKPAALFVSHVLDDIPTEIHVFSSFTAGVPVYVATGQRVWQVNGRAITVTDMKPPAPPKP